MTAVFLDEISALSGARYANVNRQSFRTHAQATRLHVVDVCPRHPEQCIFIRFFNRFCSDYNLASISISTIGQVLGQNLSLRPHQAANRRLNFTDSVEAGRAIAVNHDKLKVLRFFEEVVHDDAGFEVRVKVVL